MKDNPVATANLTSGDISNCQKGNHQYARKDVKKPADYRSVGALLTSNIASTVLTVIGGLLVARFLGPRRSDHSVLSQSL